MTKIVNLKQGESFEFAFTRGPDNMGGWTAEVQVTRFVGDIPLISRQIPLTHNATQWSSELTPSETDALPAGLYRLLGVLRNAVEGMEEVVTDTRIQVGPGAGIAP